jgi:hypothetical protein
MMIDLIIVKYKYMFESYILVEVTLTSSNKNFLSLTE